MTGRLFGLILVCAFGTSCGRINTDMREKRNVFYPPPLVYPLGGTIKLVIGFAVPVQLAGRILVYGQNFQFQYALPQNATFFSNLLENGRGDSSRRRRDLDVNGRTAVFDVLEQNFRRPEHAEDPSFPEDFLQAAEAAKGDKDCSAIYPACPEGQGFLDRITRVIT
ncbi:hypothetical protein KPH14_010680 [Odynerus spinipes]|uniref:Uncharacterized protein n=1 Tax=Odynerus spinipes TaxID=1348599 RepID=A0AAD9RVE4_9HYME|nr:hypothetical protein KPH14_010680 [Odynerus spinipes]